MVGVVGGLELDVHKVAGSDGSAEEEDLHGGVVHRDEVGEQVQVPGDEHHGEQDLGPSCSKKVLVLKNMKYLDNGRIKPTNSRMGFRQT